MFSNICQAAWLASNETSLEAIGWHTYLSKTATTYWATQN